MRYVRSFTTLIASLLLLFGLVSGCVSDQASTSTTNPEVTQPAEQFDTGVSDSVHDSIQVQLIGINDLANVEVSIVSSDDHDFVWVTPVVINEAGFGQIDQLPDGPFMILAIVENSDGSVNENQSATAIFGDMTPTGTIVLSAGLVTDNNEVVVDAEVNSDGSVPPPSVSSWLRLTFSGLATEGLCVLIRWYLTTYYHYWCPSLSWYWSSIDASCGCCITFATCAAGAS